MAKLYIIAGCNGAGKTTASYSILPDLLNCKEFVNADEIARGLSPFNPEKASIQAGRIMLERINALLKKGIDFAFETTLSTRSYTKLIKEAQAKGYVVTLIYFWLNTVDLAIERVKIRVAAGGHNIPIETIKRRYLLGIDNLSKLFLPISDYWLIIDNSNIPYKIIAEGTKKRSIDIYDKKLYNKIIKS
jgi:predicted ABC-type ATPase